MGDRANIAFKQPKGHIFLYGHCSGSSFAPQLKEALTFGRGRWDDESYLTRICVTRISSEFKDSETGMGLSTYPTDNEHDIIEVDSEKNMVRVLSSAGFGENKWSRRVLAEWSFEDYCKLDMGDDCSPEELVEKFGAMVAK